MIMVWLYAIAVFVSVVTEFRLGQTFFFLTLSFFLNFIYYAYAQLTCTRGVRKKEGGIKR